MAGWENSTTPDVPSSSPCFVPDSMDISPLPHKAPYSYLSAETQASPTPEHTAGLDMDMGSPSELPTPPQFTSEESRPAPGECVVPVPCCLYVWMLTFTDERRCFPGPPLLVPRTTRRTP